MPSQVICARPARTALILVMTVDQQQSAVDAVRSLLADFSGLVRSVSFRAPDDGVFGVVGIGSDLWDRLGITPRPRSLHRFVEVRGSTHSAPATPGDLILHLRAGTTDLCFELARLVMDRLTGRVRIVDEIQGFRYFDERDLLGFVDGTENPEGQDAVDAVQVGDEDAPFQGGSYLVIQKYLHDMKGWNALSVEDQEKAIGRSKLDDVEMSDDVKPSNAHIRLNDISDEDGNDLDILRENMPFASLREGIQGTCFLGYAKDPAITERMLRNMFVGVPEGNHDRILDFSRAVTGGLFFVPSAELLDTF